jgi:hypothetical protein
MHEVVTTGIGNAHIFARDLYRQCAFPRKHILGISNLQTRSILHLPVTNLRATLPLGGEL